MPGKQQQQQQNHAYQDVDHLVKGKTKHSCKRKQEKRLVWWRGLWMYKTNFELKILKSIRHYIKYSFCHISTACHDLVHCSITQLSYDTQSGDFLCTTC